MFRPRAWLLALLMLAPAALAQDEKKTDPKAETKPDVKVETKDVSFDSPDGVELQGTLYKSVKGGTSPVVMLLHTFGKDPNLGDWKGLATTLARNGYTVLRFDYRGHGKSTVIGEPKKFWTDPVNAKYMPMQANKVPLPKKIDIKDVTAKPNYFPMIVNDILAARIALDKMNDAGDVNTSSVYLIGSTDAATLGLLYMAVEWSRPQVVQQANNWINIRPYKLPNNTDPAGKDIAGAVWLSAERHQSISQDLMKNWITLDSALEMRDKNPMLFLYGAKDTSARTGSASAKFFVNDVLVAKPPKGSKVSALPFTEYLDVKDTANVGVNLLGNKLGTEETIVKYLENLEKDRKNVVRTPNRNWTKTPYVVLTEYGAFGKN